MIKEKNDSTFALVRYELVTFLVQVQLLAPWGSCQSEKRHWDVIPPFSHRKKYELFSSLLFSKSTTWTLDWFGHAVTPPLSSDNRRTSTKKGVDSLVQKPICCPSIPWTVSKIEKKERNSFGIFVKNTSQVSRNIYCVLIFFLLLLGYLRVYEFLDKIDGGYEILGAFGSTCPAFLTRLLLRWIELVSVSRTCLPLIWPLLDFHICHRPHQKKRRTIDVFKTQLAHPLSIKGGSKCCRSWGCWLDSFSPPFYSVAAYLHNLKSGGRGFHSSSQICIPSFYSAWKGHTGWWIDFHLKETDFDI